MPLESDQSTFGRHPGISGCGLVPQVFAAACRRLSRARCLRKERCPAEWRREVCCCCCCVVPRQQTRLWMAQRPRIRMMHLITKSQSCRWLRETFCPLRGVMRGGIVNRFPALCHSNKRMSSVCDAVACGCKTKKRHKKWRIRFA